MFLSNPSGPSGAPPSDHSLYRTYGALLKGARLSTTISQKQLIEEISLPYFRARHVAVLNWRMYSAMERDERTPLFEELEPLYRTFAEGCVISFSNTERDLYVKLARERIEAKKKKAQHIQSGQWDRLAEVLANIGDRKRSHIYLLDQRELKSSLQEEDKASRRLKALAEALHTDTSHLLERDQWVQQMLAYISITPAKKVVTIQGHQGTGKSHALALLTQRFAQQSDVYLIPYRFQSGEGKTPEDHLSVFLATILTDLMQVTTLDETKQSPFEERIDQVLSTIKQRNEQGQKVIFLLDDGQEIFPSAIEWSPTWKQFFQAFVREPHTATLYLATRTWPEWIDRRRTYLEETDLPELSPEAGVAMWQRFGFTDVPEELIYQVVKKWGSNPHLIEMRASHLKQPPWALVRNQSSSVKACSTEESENTIRLKNLLEQDALFNVKTDIEAQQILQHVISSRLSHPALRMLECLALSPLGLPFSLLEEDFPRVYVAFDELTRASLTDLRMASANRAAVAPLVREAQIQTLINDGRYSAVESRVTDLYAHWLHDVQDFRDDAEKSALIAEMVVRYIRSRQLLTAAELFISFGWLCTLFGHSARIHRVFDETVKTHRGQNESIEQEVGRLILKHRLSIQMGQKIERDERDQMYQYIHLAAVKGDVTLQPHSELEVLHNMLLFYSRRGELVEASIMFDQTFERLQRLHKLTSEVYALFSFDKGRLMSYMADQEKEAETSLKFTEASANHVKDSITNWRSSLRNALPLQEHYFQFKLARALNDLACDLRTLKQYSDACQAIEESIKLKKKTGTPSYSVATALSEYSQILAAQGKIRDALSVNEEAKNLLEQSVANGDNLHKPELGLVLKERADILMLRAHFAEAKPLFEQAVELIDNKPLRQKDKARAKAQIEHIRLITSSSQPYQLDRRWFSRYADLVDFHDTTWLTQSGPFTESEAEEWKYLSAHEDKQSRDRKSKLMALSKKREFQRSLDEKREPMILHPSLRLDEVRKYVASLKNYRREIESQEQNIVVRRFYLDAIDDNLTFLRLCEAIALQDPATAMQCNVKLYGKPSEREFKIALQQLCQMLFEASTHPLANPPASEALEQLKEWGISPDDIVSEDLFIPSFSPIQRQINHKMLANEKKKFSTATICRFFQAVLEQYGENDWHVYVNSARDHTTVDPNIKELILPETNFPVRKVRQLLAEEIETHSYRAIAGRNSSLALLGSGLANHLAADEGLAYHYVQSVSSAVYGEYEEKRWNATLTTGLVAGVLTHALSFPELRSFLEKMFLVNKLLEGDTYEDAFVFAMQAAWRRCNRVFQGGGCVSLKDRVYLQGHLEISDYLSQGGEEQRLYVGCVGIEHLEDLAELGITTPNYPHQHLALATDLADRLASYDR